ncbi:MAG: TlpA family protein disulfide reductase [Deltaproteobacteria bacterium]|nr:TlpA family protein disulfide reductase [Deltaproteobacteria bacterium]
MAGLIWLERLKCAWVIGLIVFGAVSSFAADLTFRYEKVGLSVPNSRVHAQDFQTEDLQGKLVSLSNFRGKIVLLNFWATWCKPCVVEMPDLEKLHQRYKNDGLVVLTINYGETKEKVKGFMTRNRLNLPVLLDPTKKISKRYRTFALPTTYLVDRAGYLLAGAIGHREWNSPQFHMLVEELLNSSK